MPETDSAICAVTMPMRLRVSTSATWRSLEPAGQHERGRDDREDDEAEPPVGDEERDHRGGQEDHVRDERRHALRATSETASTSDVSRAMIQPAFCCEK